MKSKRISTKTVINIFVAVLCAFIILYFLFSQNGLRDLLNSNFKFNYLWLSIAFLVHFINLFCDIYLIYSYIATEYRDFKFSDAIRVGLLGQFWGAVTPSSTGGQPMQIYWLSKKGIDIGYSTSKLIQKFLVYQVTMTILSIIAVISNFNIFAAFLETPVLIAFVAVGFSTQLIVTAAFLIFSFNEALTQKIIFWFARFLSKLKFIKNVDEKTESIKKQLSLFHTSNKSVYKNTKLLIKSIIITVIQLIAIFSVPYCVFRSFNLSNASLFDIICGQSFVNLVSGMIPIPGASGAAEVGFSTLLAVFFSPETIKSATLIWRMITYYFTVLISVPFAYLNKQKEPSLSDIAEEIEKKS